jgi:hypothetical protein
MDHGHEHGHDHHHGHEHAHHHHDHGHTHAHGAGDYYLEQLLTIFVCGAYGVVAILMYRFRMLDIVLVDVFHPWVLGGGIVLLLFSVIRGIALWRAAGAHAHHHHDHAHDHAHEHGPDCDHGHAHEHGPECDHAHGGDSPGGHHHGHAPGDDHSHGNIFWRVVVLAFPLLLFCLGLPNKGFSKEWLENRLGKDPQIGDVAAVEAKGGETLMFSFDELNASANDPGKREAYQGKTVKVKGQLSNKGSGQYTLFRMKMTCCAADTIPLKAVIKTPFVSQIQDFKWVTAEGVLQFVEQPDKKQFIPVIRVNDAAGLQESTPEK